MIRAALLLVLLLVISGCPKTAERPVCSELTLAGITAECQAQVQEHCAGLTEAQCNEKSDVLRKCDDRIEEWQQCQ